MAVSESIQGELAGLSVDLEQALREARAQDPEHVHELLERIKARVDRLRSRLQPLLALQPDPEGLAPFLERRLYGAAALHRSEMARLREGGFIDANGNRVREDLPPDMREGSACDV